MSKILIIGGGIFVGRTIAEYFSLSNETYVLNRGNNDIPSGCHHLKADRNNLDEFRSVLGTQDFDVVIDTSCLDGNQMKLSIECLEGRVGRYVYISSSAVYSNYRFFPLKETAETEGGIEWDKYGVDKLHAEEVLRGNKRVPYTILRPFYIYGNHNNLPRESYVFLRLINDSPIILPSMGNNIIHFGYINDLALAIEKAVSTSKSENQIYNIAGDEFVSYLQWVSICASSIYTIRDWA